MTMSLNHCLPLQALPLLSLGWWPLPISWMLCLSAQKRMFCTVLQRDILKTCISACCVKMCVLCHISGGFLYFTYFCFFLVTHQSQWHSLQFLNDHFRTLLFLFFFHYWTAWMFTVTKYECNHCNSSDISSSFVVWFTKILSCFCCLEFWRNTEIIQLKIIIVTERNIIWKYWVIFHWSGKGV